MDYIKAARELGKAIQETEEYKALEKAKLANDEDNALENLVGEFNMKRIQINDEMSKQDKKDDEKIKKLDAELKEVYNKIMANKNMMAYNEARGGMDKIMDKINTIVGLSANGRDPETIDPEPPTSCSGSCSSCGGCH